MITPVTLSRSGVGPGVNSVTKFQVAAWWVPKETEGCAGARINHAAHGCGAVTEVERWSSVVPGAGGRSCFTGNGSKGGKS